MGQERPISRKARAYLTEFEAWLHDRTPDRPRAKRQDTLDDLVDGILPSVEEELATAEPCAYCGGPILRSQMTRGRHRVFCCEDCHHHAGNERRGPR